ncbi:MAG: hypothetical protein LBV04_09570 [Deferribacteraceae bacterium]|jgi:hypothetical protein|nr:hypothetical protein [Deferribacteraceae bacterium]
MSNVLAAVIAALLALMLLRSKRRKSKIDVIEQAQPPVSAKAQLRVGVKDRHKMEL